MSETKIGYKDILKQKEYMKIIVAALINRFGDSIDAVASTWLVYQITNSAAWSAIIFGVNRIPTVFITPLAGVWVEGKNKKRIMIITDLIRAACVACVATCYLLGILQPWILLLTTIIISTVEAFRGPASTALTPKILEKKYYSYGMSLMTSAGAIVELIGTAAAAGIIAIVGISGAIYIDMITFMASALIIVFLNTKEQNLQKSIVDAKKFMEEFTDGIKYVTKQKVVCFFTAYTVFANACMVPLSSLQAPLVSEVLHGGTEVLSIIGMGATIGMLLGSFLYPKMEKLIKGKFVFVLSQIYIGVYYIGMVCCQPLYGNKIFMYAFVAITTVLIGFFVAIGNSYMSVESMRRIDEGYLARFSSISTSLSCATLPIVSFIISGVVSYVSTAAVFAVTGIGNIIICMFIARSHVLDDENEIEMKNEQAVV